MEVCLYVWITFCNSLAIWLCTLDLVIGGTKLEWLKQVILTLSLFAQLLDLVLKFKKMKIFSKNLSCKDGLVMLIRYFLVNLLSIFLFSFKLSVSWS